jgi:DNA-binding NarL/FixJ family response regulator
VELFSLGEPGWEHFCQDPRSWDAVLIDLELPDISGREIIPKIAAQCPQLPIVVYSGLSGLKHRFEIISTGATALLSKPSNAQDLLDILKYVIEKPPEWATRS